MSELCHYSEFVWYRALAELRADSSRNLLGFFWWVAEPILYMAVFYVIFGMILQQRGDNYVPFLLCGLIVWKWFDSSVKNASLSISHNMGLIYQVYLPKWTFPAVAVISSTLRFMVVFAIFLAYLLFDQVAFTHHWLVDLPLLLLLQVLLMLGLAMTLAAVTPFFPDIKLLIDNGLTLLFFASGIFFRFDSIPGSLRIYFEMNPIGVLIQEYRRVLIEAGTIEWAALLPVLVISLGLVLMGASLLRRWDRVYAKSAVL